MADETVDEFYDKGVLFHRRTVRHGLGDGSDGRQKARDWIQAISAAVGEAVCGVCARQLGEGDFVTGAQPNPHDKPFSHVVCYRWWASQTSVEDAEELCKISDYALDHEFIRGAREARDRQRDETGDGSNIFMCARCGEPLGWARLDMLADDPALDGVSHAACMPDVPPQLAFNQ